ncbi:MAG: hypothetical protein H8D23_19930 [Candidatus Brocadiales bacterium]|nr:hypothetical protein [Candidatus Brocadiales bacterium]
MQDILESFNRLKAERVGVAADYEQSQSYEMAYIALWSILETALKDITPYAKKIVLLKKVNDWKDYLEGNSSNPPKEIRSFQITRSDKIPPISLVEALLGDCPTIREILNTESKNGSTKWRDKRNRIAHNAEEFHRLETYQEYKNKLLDGMDEFVKLLSNVTDKT